MAWASREEIVPTYRIPALVRAPEIKWRVAGRCVNRIFLFSAQWFSVGLAAEVEDEVVFEMAA
jgi:hypothetical protein